MSTFGGDAPTGRTGRKRSVRASQPAARSGPGIHFLSPLKARDTRKKRTVTRVGRAQTITALRSRLHALLDGEAGPSTTPDLPVDLVDSSGDTQMEDWIDMEPPTPAPAPISAPRPSVTAAARQATAWSILLPTLDVPYAQYCNASYRQRPSIIPSLVRHQCLAGCGVPVTAKVQCLYISRVYYSPTSIFPLKPVQTWKKCRSSPAPASQLPYCL